MKRGTILGLVMAASVLLCGGCQSGARGLGRSAHDAPANSIDGYAKVHGVSRAEAAKRLRERLVAPEASSVEPSPVVRTSATEEQVEK